jgi:hypothetical protein
MTFPENLRRFRWSQFPVAGGAGPPLGRARAHRHPARTGRTAPSTRTVRALRRRLVSLRLTWQAPEEVAEADRRTTSDPRSPGELTDPRIAARPTPMTWHQPASTSELLRCDAPTWSGAGAMLFRSPAAGDGRAQRYWCRAG